MLRCSISAVTRTGRLGWSGPTGSCRRLFS